MEAVTGNTAAGIRKVVFDSRKVGPGDVFVAIRGSLSDGHDYIDQAVEAGALAVVCEDMPADLVTDVTYVQVKNTQKALALIAANYYDNPSAELRLVGVTGTNGKTTIATLLYELFTRAGYSVGLLSTVKVMVGDQAFDAVRTTPDSLAINAYLRQMKKAGVEFCFMEVSSHGIAQHRTTGLAFKGGIFTNLSHDHLDYHKDFAEYRDVKKRFFDELPASAFALTNADDKNGLVMLQNTRAQKYTYALRSYADFQAQILENQFTGLLLKVHGQDLWTQLIGTFNAYNILAIFATAELLGLETLETLKLISGLGSVSGRFQYLISEKKKITAIVDYAHTPDALKNVLETINTIRTRNEKLITVVGCGGDRDRTKRPEMGRIGAALSTQVILTSDNPRSEDPEQIIEEIAQGVEPQDFKKISSITNRRQAIKMACQLADTNDIILIAGKGHENYQEIKGERFEFDDYKIVEEFLKELEK